MDKIDARNFLVRDDVRSYEILRLIKISIEPGIYFKHVFETQKHGKTLLVDNTGLPHFMAILYNYFMNARLNINVEDFIKK